MFVWETIRFVVVDAVWSIVSFPIWWYTVGAMKVLHLIRREAGALAQSLNLRVLLKFLFKPMFGQSDIIGRIISICVRIVHFCILATYSAIITILLVLLLIAWLLLPPFILYNVWFHLFGTTYAQL
jgi:hypothetical protein